MRPRSTCRLEMVILWNLSTLCCILDKSTKDLQSEKILFLFREHHLKSVFGCQNAKLDELFFRHVAFLVLGRGGGCTTCRWNSHSPEGQILQFTKIIIWTYFYENFWEKCLFYYSCWSQPKWPLLKEELWKITVGEPRAETSIYRSGLYQYLKYVW